MSIKREPPRPLHRRLTKQHKVVRVLIHDGGRLDQFAEKMVDTHCADSLLVSFWRQSRFNDAKHCISLCLSDLIKADAMVVEKKLWVRPGAPFRGVDVMTQL